jgi:hypothetical protein
MRTLAMLACLAGVMPTATAQQPGPPPVSLPQPSHPPIVPAPSPAFDPAKPNEVGPVWTYHDEKRPFIIMALPAGHSETRIFTIRNTGPDATGPMRFWIESEGGTGPSRIVKIDPASDCVTRGAAPNGTCSVNLTVTAVADGQFMAHVRFPQGIRNGPPGVTLRTILEIHGYGTGFGTKLPDGVVGNGSRCPALGSHGEIALSNFGHGSGYTQQNPEGPGFILSTAECKKIEFTRGRMDNEEGRICERPVVKQYRASSVGGPWTFVSQKEQGFRLALLCENDILKLAIGH